MELKPGRVLYKPVSCPCKTPLYLYPGVLLLVHAVVSVSVSISIFLFLSFFLRSSFPEMVLPRILLTYWIQNKNTVGKCSIPAPRCDTPAGIGMGWCMDATSTCSPTSFNNGLPGRPGKIVSFVKPHPHTPPYICIKIQSNQTQLLFSAFVN